jgi:thiamine biosynthesis lipoprotein
VIVPLRLALAAMATRFELLLEGGEEGAGESSARAAGEAALEAIEDVERRLSRFRRDSWVARLSEPAGAAPKLLREEIALLEVCRRACARSDGAFDPALARSRDDGRRAPPFSRWRIDRRGRRLFAPEAGATLDFGGIGKGHALDLAVRELRAAGIRRALIHGGTSSVAALGTRPGSAAGSREGPSWRVALRDPLDSEGSLGPLGIVELRDAALSVSARGNVDPRDGSPVERARLAAVVAPHGAVAEAWSTALLVLAERKLRAGEPIDDLERALPPLLTALLAVERDGELEILRFGRRPELFTVRARTMESTR